MTANLHLLDEDILFDLLTLCSNLADLHSIILTHPRIHSVFNSRRRLILKLVFRQETTIDRAYVSISQRSIKQPSPCISKANTFIIRQRSSNPLDLLAFREALWPSLERQIPEEHALSWARALLAAYHNAQLKTDALIFARRTTDLILASLRIPNSETCKFIRSVARTYVSAGHREDALALQHTIRVRMNPRSPDHSVWSKELIVSARGVHSPTEVLNMLVSFHTTYCIAVGPGSEVALDWARNVVREYAAQKRNTEALEFHACVRADMSPQNSQYIAWSRHLITMYKRDGLLEQALAVTEQVCRHLSIRSHGYRAWMTQLAEAYENAGRMDDAVRVYEEVWRAYEASMKRERRVGEVEGGDVTYWIYHAKGAGLGLAKMYRRVGRAEEAGMIEGRVEGFSEGSAVVV